MNRAYYSDEIKTFLTSSTNEILGILADKNEFATEQTQKDAWKFQIEYLQEVLKDYSGSIYFEYAIPRMGKRIDVLLIIKSILFVVEFKVGDREYASHAIDQVWDYALDLKNFHETSHNKTIVPILLATKAKDAVMSISSSKQDDNLYDPVKTNDKGLGEIISHALLFLDGQDAINKQEWENGRYQPTPTIIEAATALYNNHTVKDISRNDALAINLSKTTDEITKVIQQSRNNSEKSICFVTGVPGAGKTLVGLNIATSHFDKESELYSVFLSGNGPLVKVLQEALAIDKVSRAKAKGEKLTKKVARSEVQTFIQNVHHFRDEGLRDKAPPIEHVTLFDEAQRAWTKEQTTSFMKQKKGVPDFNKSEPEFLISCLDRHPDWAVVVCLVGGGQEINTGEAGISEWISAPRTLFPRLENSHVDPIDR